MKDKIKTIEFDIEMLESERQQLYVKAHYLELKIKKLEKEKDILIKELTK